MVDLNFDPISANKTELGKFIALHLKFSLFLMSCTMSFTIKYEQFISLHS
jgi:hypothetical protein